MMDFGTQIIFVGKTGKLKVRDYSSVHGAVLVNVTVVNGDGRNLLSLNLSADKAKELQSALGALLGTIPPSWADLQVTP